MRAFVKSVVFAAALLTAGACGQRAVAPPALPTFDKDIAPIVFTNCAPCHRPGQVAPFSLLTYADVAKHADNVVRETSKRHMPPWLPDRGDFPIAGERRLRQDQIDLLRRWVDSGMKEGAPVDLPPRPEWRDGWQLGKPDLILTPARAFVLKPGTEDVYRNLILHSSLSSVMYVRAVEFSTGGAPIHHAVVRVDRTGASRARDGEDGQPGFDGMAWQNVQDPDGQFIGWAPGRGPIESPNGMPWRLDPGADLVVELHMLPPKKPAAIQPAIALYLTTTPPTASPVTVTMSPKTIDIPAGKADYTITDTYDLPVSVDLLSVYPHAHYLGKDMLVTATMADGSTKTLLHIPQWSFHWQQDYRYVTPVPLAAGTRITMKYTYDNSGDNEDNPHKPPVRVQLGPKSTDEMAQLGLQFLPKSRVDAARIAATFAERDALANVALGEMRVRESPDNAEYQAFLGASYIEVDRYAEAIPHLETAVRLDPRSASAHGDLGSALLAQGRVPQALTHLKRAAALAPRDATFAFNLGNGLARASRPSDAAAAYLQALAIDPDYVDALANLGVLLFQHDRVDEALKYLARAAELRPDSAVIHTNYGSALASTGHYADARREFERALVLNPEYAPARENLTRLAQIR